MPPSRTKGQYLTIWDHLSLLLRWRKQLMIYLFIMLIGSVTYALLAKVWYRSEATVLPPPSNTLGLGGLLPSLAGGAIGMGALQGDESLLLMTILESRRLKDQVIDKFDWMDRFNLRYRLDAYKRYIKVIKWEVSEDGYFNIIAEDNDPKIAQETVNFIVDVLKQQFAEITIDQARTQRKFVEQRLDQNYKDLANAEEAMKEFQEKTGVILMEDQVKATVETVSKLYGDLVLAEVRSNVLKKTMPPSSSEVINAQQNVDALRNEIERLTKSDNDKALNYLIDLDVAPDVGMQYFRLQRDIEIQSTILEFLLPQFEQAKIQEMHDKSELYVIDDGALPEKKTRPRRSFIVVGWLFLSIIIFYLYVKYLEYMEELRETGDPRYDRFREVADMMKPKNLFSSRPGRS